VAAISLAGFFQKFSFLVRRVGGFAADFFDSLWTPTRERFENLSEQQHVELQLKNEIASFNFFVQGSLEG